MSESYRLFDFHIFDDKTTGEYVFNIQMFGINENGETASIIVNDYMPFFYVKVFDKWSERETRMFSSDIEKNVPNALNSMRLVQKKKLYGFNDNKKFQFLYLKFTNTISMNRVKRYIMTNKFSGRKLELYESGIPPLLRYFHVNSVSPSGWVEISSEFQDDDSNTTCAYNYLCSSSDLKPLNNKESMVPYKICSYDIEASSSHGDFPVPKKSFKKLATNIHDLYKLHKPEKERIGKLIEKIIRAAFGYGKFDDVDLVYPTTHPSKETVNKVIKVVLKKCIQDVEMDAKTQDIMNISRMFEKMRMEEEDDHDNMHSKTNKVDDKMTIVELLDHESLTRDKKIYHIDDLLTALFKSQNVILEGDKVTFIGSTFMKYGEKEPYMNHCLVLGGCDDVDGAIIDRCETEIELLEKWRDLMIEEDPDIIIGYNIFGFDYEFMFRRAEENKMEKEFLTMSRIKSKPCYKTDSDCNTMIENTKVVLASGEYDLKYYSMPGRLQIDMYTYFRRDFNLASYKLDDVAGQYISDDIKKLEIVHEDDQTYTDLYSKNLTGLNVGDYIHIELCGFTTDYYDDGRKFQVINITKTDGFAILRIKGQHNIDTKKSMKWTMAKDDVTPQDIFRLSKGSDADRAIVAKYCIQDCNLVHHLMNKIDVVTGYVEMASICSVPMSFLVLRGQGIKLTSYVAKKCMEKGTLMPDLDRSGENEGYEGAIVLPPKCSMYMDNPVACVDYASLYPSSMISQNYSHDSKVWTKEYDLEGNLVKETGEKDKNGAYIYDNLPAYEYIDTEFDTFKYVRKTPTSKADKVKSGTKICRWAQLPNNEKSIMPSILQELLKARSATKKLMKKEEDPFMQNILDKRQLGYKVTANSLYGQCGAKTSTFYEKDVAASTTATGRQMIMYAKGMVEEMYGNKHCDTKCHGQVLTKAEYVYGDTDSVFFTFNLEDPKTNKPIRGKKALEITIEIAQEVAELCTSFLKPPMGLEYEKTLMPFVLLSKKRYVGMLYEFDHNKGSMKYMGLSLKRRDSCDYLKDTYGEILNILMKEHDLEKSITYLNNCLDDLVNGRVPMDKLSITRALRSDYKNPSQIAHRVLADRIGQRDPGNKPKPGDRIKYVFIDTQSPKSLLGDRIETPEYIVENKKKIDYNYYITNQLMKPLQQLYGLALETIWENRKKKGLIKEYKKDMEKMAKDYENDLEAYAKAREKYCSARVKTILFDGVLTKINNDRANLKSITSFFKKN